MKNITLNIRLYSFYSSSLLGVKARIYTYNFKIALIKRILFYNFSFVPQRQDESPKTKTGIIFHNMPKNRFLSDFNHGFGFHIRFLLKTSPHPSTENNNINISIIIHKRML